MKFDFGDKLTSVIVAVNELGYIDDGNNGLPWGEPIKADMEWFRKHTEGHAVFMGRKTFESIGEPLRNRFNFVMSSRRFTCKVINQDTLLYYIGNKDELLIQAKWNIKNHIFFIGGKSIFDLVKDSVDRVYLTTVNGNFTEGTIKFDYDVENPLIWKVLESSSKGSLNFTIYERIK